MAVGGMAAHGLVNGMSGASPTGMSEANLPRLHLRPDSLKNSVSVSNRCRLRDGATSVFAITSFIGDYEITCGLVAKKSSEIHA